MPEGYDPQNWTVIGGGDFKAFWALHWGKDELSRLRTKPLAERFLSIARTRDVLDLIQGPPSADPSLLFRDEYDSFIKHLDAAWQNKATTGMRGCLLLGQPAIGTSCSLLFLLIHCLSRKQAVLFTTSSGRTFRFDERGVATIMASEFAGCLHLPPRTHANEPTFWSLVDRPESEVLVLSPVTKGTGRLFFVAAAISDPDDTSHWDPSIGSYQMEPWSKEELLALWTRFPPTDIAPEKQRRYNLERLELPPAAPGGQRGFKFDLETVESLIADVGPCPRDILSHLRAPDRYVHRMGTMDPFLLASPAWAHAEPARGRGTATEAAAQGSGEGEDVDGGRAGPPPAKRTKKGGRRSVNK